MSNVITAYFKGRTGVAEAVYQNDYGMVMAFDGIYLPAHFDCYFSVSGSEDAIPGIGADNRVTIPNAVLAVPGKVEIHIPMHTGTNDSEVKYVVYFKVINRSRPADDGTPVQMTAIEQALALLQNPIGNIEAIVEEALSFTGETFEEMQEDLTEWKGGVEEGLDTWKDGVEDGIDTFETQVMTMVGTPLVAGTVAGMTDHSKIYVYTGSETGYTAGNWYYWNGSAWTSGGTYNSTAFTTDTTLTASGAAADSKTVGDKVSALKEDIIKNDDMQSASLWSLGQLNVTNGDVSASDKSIVSDWVRVSKGSTISTINGYKRSYCVNSEPFVGGSYVLESASQGTGSVTVTHDGYLRVCVFPPSVSTVDISIRTNLDADIIQRLVDDNVYDIEHLNNAVDSLVSGLIDSQNGELYFKKVADSYVGTNGTIAVYNGWSRTDYIPVSNLSTITITKETASLYNVWFDSSKNKVGSNFNTPIGSKTFDIPSSAAYVMLSDTTSGLNSTKITTVTKTENEVNKVYKSVNVVNPYFSRRYTGDTVIGEQIALHGCYFRFDSIEIRTSNHAVYSADWNQFLSDLSDVFSPSAGLNAPTVAYDYTTNCARLDKNWLLIYNTDSEKFEALYTTAYLTPSQVVLIGCDNVYTPFGVVYEYAKLTEKRGLKCYMDSFNEAEDSAINDKSDFMFTFATDCHFPFDDYSTYYNPTNEVINKIDDCFHVDAIINGGDSTIHGSKRRTYALGAYGHVFDQLEQDKIVYCMGNHDWNGVSSISSQQDVDWSLDNLSTDNLFMRHNRKAVFPSGDGVKYFYRDFEEKKIRVIVLNTSDIDISFTDDIIDIDPLMVLGIRQAQLTWLADTALNVSDDDWHIIIIMHGGLYLNADGFPGNTPVINKSAVIQILSAYVNKTTYSYSGTDTDHDGYFTVNGSGSFAGYHGSLVGVWSGHAHADGYCDKDGFNAIQTECSYLDYDQKPQRIVRTIDEVAVDCVSIDKVDRKIMIRRFGYGSDRNYTY